ncbi:MAG: phosphogluconate dehydrogenase (NADP(+)-dependent, decarboxylating) [Gammaproteobacteria bacterium]|nr:MAG: phosphogluconate dehydrogenase (NADP(+)-dependent, decarboxylating) [Gammaproteobacteria bacterium]
MPADIGVIGLAVMGKNLILNVNDNGFTVVVYNRTTTKVSEFLNGDAKGTNIIGAYGIEELVEKLAKPRKILLMVKAGQVVDTFIDQLLPLLDKGDIIIDGGNSNYLDSNRRTQALAEQGIAFIAAGISGGEEGARFGPSIMPGGNPDAWETVKPIFQAIAAKTDSGEACCDWVGNDGAGHFVKMVHNGIEYGDMQLISETYYFMKHALGLDCDRMQRVFADWNNTELNSYLIEITGDILGVKDRDGTPLVDKILDRAGQKGTGKWTGISALEMGTPLTLITESVFARYLSSLVDERACMAKCFPQSDLRIKGDTDDWVQALRKALLGAKIISYAQGFMLLKQADDHFKWSLDFGNIALMWRGGCIIRSVFLDNIRDAYNNNKQLEFLGADPYFANMLTDCLPSWRRVAAKSLEIGLPMPGVTSALAFLDGLMCERSSANMIQAQRDYFGAHTYERIDKPRGEFFHTDWIGARK